MLQSVINARRAEGQNVFLADLFSAVDGGTMLQADGTHQLARRDGENPRRHLGTGVSALQPRAEGRQPRLHDDADVGPLVRR